MKPALALTLAATVLAGACQLNPVTIDKTVSRPKASSQDKKAEAELRAETPRPTPTAPSTLIEGLMAIDAHYVVSAGGGNVISAGGGNVISAGGGNVISAGGGNVVSAGGGNVISAGGGNLIGGAGANFKLLEALSVPLGTQLPAAGMVVVPVSLLTRRQIGEAVFTGADGRFTVAVPDAELIGSATNILLYAAVPGKDEADPLLQNSRFRYNVIVAFGADGAQQIDEDRATLTAYWHSVLADQLRLLFTPAMLERAKATRDATGEVPIEEQPLYDPDYPPYAQEILKLLVYQLLDGVDKYDIPPDRFSQGASRLADVMLAYLDIGDVPIRKNKYTGRFSQMEPAMLNFSQRLREQAAPRLGELSSRYQAELKAVYPGDPSRHTLVRPSDASDFVVRHFLGGGKEPYKQLPELFALLGMADEAETEQYLTLLEDTGESMVLKIMTEYLTKSAKDTAEGRNPIDQAMRSLGSKQEP